MVATLTIIKAKDWGYDMVVRTPLFDDLKKSLPFF
jgi:hypothetical protein